MSNYRQYHQRMASDPARIHDWHVRHRSLSLTARMHADIQLPSSPTRSEAGADRDTGFPEPLSLGTIISSHAILSELLLRSAKLDAGALKRYESFIC